MGKKVALAIVLFAVIAVSSLSLTNAQTTRTAGVHAGDQFEYVMAGSGVSNANGPLFDYSLLKWATLTIDDVNSSGRLITYHWDIQLSNGSIIKSPFVVDVADGIFNAGGIAGYFPSGMLIIAANMQRGDSLFTNPSFDNKPYFNETLSFFSEDDPNAVYVFIESNMFTHTNPNYGRYYFDNSSLGELRVGDFVVLAGERGNATYNGHEVQPAVQRRIISITEANGVRLFTVQGTDVSDIKVVNETEIANKIQPLYGADPRIFPTYPNTVASSNAYVPSPYYIPTGTLVYRGVDYASPDGSVLTDYAYWYKSTGVPQEIAYSFHSANGTSDYSIQMMIAQPGMAGGGVGTISSNQLSLQPLAFVKAPSLPPQEAVVVTGAGTAVVAFASVGAFLFAAIPDMPAARFDSLPDPIKRLVKGSVGKKLEELFKAKEQRKSALVTAGELGVLSATVVFTALVVAYCDLKGYPQVLNVGLFLTSFFAALVSAAIVQSASFTADAICSIGVRAQKKLNLWNIGTLTWFASGLVAQLPFSSPSISKTLGDSKFKVPLQQKITALNTAVKASMVALLFIPFTLMSTLKVLPAVGNTGLLIVAVTLCLTLMPFKPFAGKGVRAYNGGLSVVLVVGAGLLVVAQYLKALDSNTYLGIGFSSAVVLVLVLWKLSSEKRKLRQAYPDLWFKWHR